MHVWASALFILDRRAMRDALRSGTSNWYSDPHFFVSCTEQSIFVKHLSVGLLLGKNKRKYEKEDSVYGNDGLCSVYINSLS